jgi:hypothetical protein
MQEKNKKVGSGMAKCKHILPLAGAPKKGDVIK